MGRNVRCAQALLLAFGLGAPAMAQTLANAPDKSAFSLFDPTPDADLRSFCTDRPPKANLPCTVDAGHFQYEADVVNWTYVHTGGLTMNTFLFANPTLKLGLTNTSDLELNMDPIEAVSTKKTVTGIGDLFVRLK